MKIKVKHLLIIAVSLGFIAFAAVIASAEGPYASVRYFNDGSSVDAVVYWNDSAANGGPYSFAWADDVIASGADLDWQGVSPSNPGTADAYVKLDSLTKYKNYYFKIYSGSNVTIVRSFPVDFNNTTNPDRYQNDYAHGNFASGTAMCAYCHSTHASLKGQLLVQETYYELCMVCHSNSNSQSKYDVERGKVYMGPGSGWVDSLAGPIGSGLGTVTSKHDVDDRVDTSVYVPGSDPGQVLTFTCLSCHDAHGGTNDNYRLLKKTVYPGDNKWNPQTVDFQAFAVVKNLSVGEDVYFISGNSEFCSACHLDYVLGTAGQMGGVFNSAYKHPVTVGSVVYSVHPNDFYPTTGDYLPLQVYADGESRTADKRTAVVCETCHFAHGTYKSFNVSLPPDGTTVSNEKMLRLDNYGVCQSCHKK